MINFFIYDSNSFSFALNNEMLFLCKEFEELVKADSSKDKSNVYEACKYIFFMEDPRSPYNDFSPEEKEKMALADCNPNWEELDKLVVDHARLKYSELLDSNMIVKTVRDLEIGLHKLSSYCRLVDFNKVIESGPSKGKMMHSPTELLRITKELDQSINTAKRLRKTLEEELKQESAEVRGDADKGWIQ